MQEIIIERLIQSLAQWFSNLDFTLSKQNDKLSLTCKELNIKIENLPREEFITAVIEKGTDGLEKLFNLKALGIDLKDFFGVKKQEPKVEKPEPKKEEPKPRLSAKPENIEDWIEKELKKAFERGDLGNKKNSIEELFEVYKNQPVQPYDPFNPFRDWPKRFPWNDVICFGG